MTHLIYKNMNTAPLPVTGGAGVWLEVSGKRRILDTCGGVVVSSLGHCHPRIMAAMAKFSQTLSWAHAGSFTSQAAEELADFLGKRAGALFQMQFLSGGSEAMELALKVAYQYHFERGEPQRTVFVSRRQSYHGSTLGTLALSGNRARRAIYAPFFFDVEFVSPCYAYRDKNPEETDDNYTSRLSQELEDCIARVGPHRVAAFVAEPVVGSTSGAVPAVPGYFQKIKSVCERHGILLILDDVMSGMGRTGKLFSHLEDGVSPDIVAIGKGLAAGYQPISGYLIAQHIYETLKFGTGVLLNGQTHVNHPFACAIALEVQKTIEEEALLTKVIDRGRYFRQGLEHLAKSYGFIGDVRGRGLFLGVEFVTDRKTHHPIKEGGDFANHLKAWALEEDLLIYPGSGTVDGKRGAHVLFGPPFISTYAEIDEMLERLNRVFARVRSEHL